MTISLRPAGPADEPLLYELYRGSRAEEVAAFGWDEAQQDAFLRMQFNARQRQYGFQYADANDGIIMLDGRDIGRLLVLRGEREIRLVDIALLPEHRNAGIGTGLVRGLIEEAARAAKPVTLHVERANPAAGLYERLGFVKVRETGAHFFMEKSPAVTGTEETQK